MLISNLIATAAAIVNGESAHKIKEDAPKKVRADVDFIVTRSGLRVNRKHLYKVPSTFPFEKLPGEIRNKIYRNFLVNGPFNIPITDMDYDEYHVGDNSTALRTPYWTVTHDDEEAGPPTNPNGTWTSSNLTTYCAPPGKGSQKEHMASKTSAFLQMNRQTRTEALPIFYGENCFSFSSEGCIIPFLQDRTALARTSIRHIRVYFLLSNDGNNKCRQRTWAANFNYIAANLPHLESLRLHIFDAEGRMLIGNTTWAQAPIISGRYMKWVRPLMNITNLKKFRLQIEMSSYAIYARSSKSGVYQQEWNAMNKWLRFLEPTMLAPGVERGYELPPASADIGAGAPSRAYVWETENEEDDTDDDDFTAGEDSDGEGEEDDEEEL